MAKAKKMTKEELQQLQQVVTKINQVKISIAEKEEEKLQIFGILQKLQEALKAEQVKIKEKYGNVSIDLSTGVITPDNE